MKKGKLYLLPTILGEGTQEQTLPLIILEYIKEGILMYPLFRKDGKTASFVLRSHLYIASGLELIKNKIELEGLDYLEPSLKEYRKTLRTLRNTEHRAVYK